MIKTIALLLAALAVDPAPLRAQSQNPPTHSQRLEDDPGFRRLSPDSQEWVRLMMDRLDKAIERRDIEAISQIRLDVAKHQLKGSELCGHVFGEGTFVDARVSGPGGDEVFAIRWLDPARGSLMHTAIFTGRKRCVVTDGDTVDGKLIVLAMPNSLAVSKNHALTAWEGEYWENPAEKLDRNLPHRGVFIENRFAFELDPAKASRPDGAIKDDPDFHWDDEQETVIPKAGVVKAPTTKASKTTSKAAAPPAGKKRILPTIPCLPFQACGQSKP